MGVMRTVRMDKRMLAQLLAYAASVAGIHGVFFWYAVVPWRHIGLTMAWAIAALVLLVLIARVAWHCTGGAPYRRWLLAAYLLALPLLMMAPIVSSLRNLVFYGAAAVGACLLSSSSGAVHPADRGALRAPVGFAFCVVAAAAACVLPAALTCGRTVAAQTGYPDLEDAVAVEINMKRDYGGTGYVDLDAEDVAAFRQMARGLIVVGEPADVAVLEPAAGWSTQLFRVTLPSGASVEVGEYDDLVVVDGERAWKAAAPFGCLQLQNLYKDIFAVQE